MLPLPVDNWEAKGHPGIPDPQNAMIYVGDSEWPRESIPPKAQKFAPSFLPSNESTFQHFRYASPEIMRTQVRWTTTKVGGLTTTGALRCNMRGQLVQKHQHIADLFIATLHQFSIGFNLTALVR